MTPFQITNAVTIKQKDSNRHVLPYTESKNSNKAYVALKSEHETMAKDLEEAKKAEAAGKAAAKQGPDSIENFGLKFWLEKQIEIPF